MKLLVGWVDHGETGKRNQGWLEWAAKGNKVDLFNFREYGPIGPSKQADPSRQIVKIYMGQPQELSNWEPKPSPLRTAQPDTDAQIEAAAKKKKGEKGHKKIAKDAGEEEGKKKKKAKKAEEKAKKAEEKAGKKEKANFKGAKEDKGDMGGTKTKGTKINDVGTALRQGMEHVLKSGTSSLHDIPLFFGSKNDIRGKQCPGNGFHKCVEGFKWVKKGKILGFRKKTRIGSPQCQKDYKPVGSRCLFKPAKIKQKYEEELSDDLAKELAEAKDMTDEAAKEAANKDRDMVKGTAKAL